MNRKLNFLSNQKVEWQNLIPSKENIYFFVIIDIEVGSKLEKKIMIYRCI